MLYTQIEKALESLGWKDRYLQTFRENQIDDETLAVCLKDKDSASYSADLSAAIPVAGHRMMFVHAFRKLESEEGSAGIGETPEPGMATSVTIKPEPLEDEECSEIVGNKPKTGDFGPKSQACLLEVKDFYVKQMKDAVVDIGNEDELRKTQGRVKRECIQKLKEEVQGMLSTPQKLADMQENLMAFIHVEFKGSLMLCRLRNEEDDLAVKTALLDAREYYNEEMGKHLKSRDWLQTTELERIHNEVRDVAVEKGMKEIQLCSRQAKQLRGAIDSMFKRFQDKNALRQPRDVYAIGIDLGTTYSCVAVCIRGKVHVIASDGKTTIPSYVAFNDDHTVSVGESAKEQAFRRPESTIFDAKRLIGRKFSDRTVQEDMKLWPFQVVHDGDQPRIKIAKHQKTYRAEEISAHVLVHLKKLAEQFIGQPVRNDVVTVPAYFSDAQRQSTKDAAEIAGLSVKILNEPTSAAIAYYYELHLPHDFKRNVLIFDLGGGTFDVAVLEMKEGKIEVKAIGGDTHLGGEDFDNEMVKHIIGLVKDKHGIDLGRDMNSYNPDIKRSSSERLRRIRSACEKHKRLLSTSTSTTVVIDRIDGNFDLYEPFTRETFENLNTPKFQQCVEIMAQVILEAKMVKDDIDDIVLIGGSTKIPKIQELLVNFFKGKALNSQINADEAVAVGAAVHAALQYGRSQEVSKCVFTSGVTPLSLGLEDASTDMHVVIPKNTPVPCSRTRDRRTVKDWQTSCLFKIFEGEKPIANDNNKLGEFYLKNIPSSRKGKESVDFTMSIDDEGILHVKAVCKSNGSSNDIIIEAHRGRMSSQEIVAAKDDAKRLKW